jgi:hypothetical protein
MFIAEADTLLAKYSFLHQGSIAGMTPSDLGAEPHYVS